MAVRFRAAADGGARGNPGPAAWGVVVLDAEGVCVEGFAGALGRATNNVAEYHGLIEALRVADQRGAEQVEIRCDSQLVVRQVQGSYRVRHPDLIPLWSEAMRRIRSFPSFKIEHVRREANKQADRMVNVALDRLQATPADSDFRLHEVCEPGT